MIGLSDSQRLQRLRRELLRASRRPYSDPSYGEILLGRYTRRARGGILLRTSALVARAHFLSTWLNANGKHGKSWLEGLVWVVQEVFPQVSPSSPGLENRRASCNDSFVLKNPQGSKRFPNRFPKRQFCAKKSTRQ